MLFRKFSSRHWLMHCIQILWNLADGKSVKSCVAYLREKNDISPGSPAVTTAWITPKICKGQPPTMYSECSRFYPNRFTFSSVIAKFMNTAKTRRKVNAIFGWSLASSRIINNNRMIVVIIRKEGISALTTASYSNPYRKVLLLLCELSNASRYTFIVNGCRVISLLCLFHVYCCVPSCRVFITNSYSLVNATSVSCSS